MGWSEQQFKRWLVAAVFSVLWSCLAAVIWPGNQMLWLVILFGILASYAWVEYQDYQRHGD